MRCELLPVALLRAAEGSCEPAQLLRPILPLCARRSAAPQAADAAEIEYTSTNALQTEDPAQTISSVAPWRVRKDHFKGFNQQQLAEVQATQAAQLDEQSQRKAAERQQELAFCAQQEAIRRTLEVKALQVENFKRDQNKAAAAFLQQQARAAPAGTRETHRLQRSHPEHASVLHLAERAQDNSRRRLDRHVHHQRPHRQILLTIRCAIWPGL